MSTIPYTNNQSNLNFTRECIDVQKVYDYILNRQQECFADTTFTFPTTANFVATDELEVFSCRIAEDGEVINGVTAVTECVELGDPDNRPTIPYTLPNNCETIDLQVVTLQKTVTLVIRVEVTATTGATTTFEAISEPLVFECEEVIMCAPEGTTVDCTITDSSRCSVYNLTPVADTDTATGLANVTACQSIQSYAVVKLEVLARFCEPRKQIKINDCTAPIAPEQCDDIFPGINNHCGC